MCRFGLLGEIISDNGKQFRDNPFKEWCEKLCIQQHFASVKHPQTNGLVERANRSLWEGIKARMGKDNKNWMEEISHVLWAYRTMVKSSNGDTPFSLTYGTEAVIPAEIGMPTFRTAELDMAKNDEALQINLELLEEKREQAAITEAKSKRQMEKYYNAKVQNTSFKPGDLVYHNNEASRAEDTGKLGPKSEGPYEVTEALGKGSYRLKDRNGKELPRIHVLVVWWVGVLGGVWLLVFWFSLLAADGRGEIKEFLIRMLKWNPPQRGRIRRKRTLTAEGLRNGGVTGCGGGGIGLELLSPGGLGLGGTALVGRGHGLTNHAGHFEGQIRFKDWARWSLPVTASGVRGGGEPNLISKMVCWRGSTSHTPVKIEAPSELPKVSLVNKSLKKLRFHLVSFDTVVKVRTTPDAITEGSWGFEHTKKVFLTEIIPWLNKLKDFFKEFDKGLHDEISEVQAVFTQMEAAVEQCSVDRKCCEIQQKQFLIENDRLLDQIISQDIMNIVVNSSIVMCDFVKKNDDAIDICNKCLELEVELAKKNVKKDIDEIEIINIELEHSVAKLLSENEKLHKEKEHLKQTYKELYDLIKPTRVRAKEQCEALNVNLNSKSMETEDLKAQIQEKLDIEPISHRLKNNRDAHEDYLKKTIENIDTIRGLVERARKQNPSEPLLDSTCMFTKHIQELLVYVSKTSSSFTKPSEKLFVVTPLNKDKKVRFADPITSSSNTQSQFNSHKTKDSNQPLLHSTGVICSTSASGSNPTGNTKNNRIS
ncbi:reverse transcriptase domain-containing protein [Tanacetum coccineum]